MLIQGIPVVGMWWGDKEVKIGTAELTEKTVTIQLQGHIVEKILELVEDGADVKAIHVEIKLQAARRKEG